MYFYLRKDSAGFFLPFSLLKRNLSDRTALKPASASLFNRSTTSLRPKREMFTRGRPHLVWHGGVYDSPSCFVFHTWKECGQDGIEAQMDKKENKICLDHDRQCYLLHISTLKPLNVLYGVWIGGLNVFYSLFLTLQCFKVVFKYMKLLTQETVLLVLFTVLRLDWLDSLSQITRGCKRILTMNVLNVHYYME